ncbi:MAG: glucokinase [Pseudomonadota bacterium]
MTSHPRRRTTDIAPIPFPVLIADIGGTNVRFAVLEDAHSALREFPTVHTAQFPDFATAASTAVLDTTAIMPRSLLIAVAGPVGEGLTKMTNADWVIDANQLIGALNLETLVIFNDFEALSLSLPALREDQVMKIGGGEPISRQPRIVLGPGTGLGVASLIYGDRSYTPLAGEGGHMDVGPITAREFEMWPHVEHLHGRVTGEALLSGNGLTRLYRAVAALEQADGSVCKVGADVTRRAGEGDPCAIEAIDHFLTFLGRYAGDLALVFLAKGGVYVAGGIVPRLVERVSRSPFRTAFEDKEPHAHLMRQMPTFLITEPRPAIAGLAAFATMPERFSIDLDGRRFGA